MELITRKKGNWNNNKHLQFTIDNTYRGLLCDHLYLYIIKLYLYQMNRNEKKHILECIYEINRKFNNTNNQKMKIYFAKTQKRKDVKGLSTNDVQHLRDELYETL